MGKKPTQVKAETPQQPEGPPRNTCFVMMPFEEPFPVPYKYVIEPAIRAAGLEPQLATSLFRSSGIMGDIWQMVQDAKVLLAVLTDRNPNVFYELGLAHAIGKPVVLVSETLDDVPFDLQSYRVQTYKMADPRWGDGLQVRITKALKETLADAASAVPSMFAEIVPSQAPTKDEYELRLGELEHRIMDIERQALFDYDDPLSTENLNTIGRAIESVKRLKRQGVHRSKVENFMIRSFPRLSRDQREGLNSDKLASLYPSNATLYPHSTVVRLSM